VHLRCLGLRGFKPFPDTLELKLEPGVSVVVHRTQHRNG